MSVLVQTRGNQPDEIVHIAIRRSDVSEPDLLRGLGAAPADGKNRQLDQRATRRIVRDGIHRVRARNDDRAPFSVEIGGNRFHAHQRRHQHVVTPRP